MDLYGFSFLFCVPFFYTRVFLDKNVLGSLAEMCGVFIITNICKKEEHKKGKKKRTKKKKNKREGVLHNFKVLHTQDCPISHSISVFHNSDNCGGGKAVFCINSFFIQSWKREGKSLVSFLVVRTPLNVSPFLGCCYHVYIFSM